MNTLQMIKDRIESANRLHQARLSITKYRGVDSTVHRSDNEVHGTFVYRGQSYTK